MSQSSSRKLRMGAPIEIDKTGIEVKKKAPQTPFEFAREEDGTLSLDAAVFQALGAASVCWEGGTRGLFMEQRATEIGRALLDEIQERLGS